MIKLVGIHGHAGSGKDTVADHLVECFDFASLAFADPLKEAAARMFGLRIHDFYEEERKEKKNDFWGVSPREIAQFFGTEMVRNQIRKLIPGVGEDFWIKRLQLEAHKSLGEENVIVIPDVRFQNELDWILEMGGVIIHLTRQGANGTVGIPNHSSEQKLETHKEGVYLIQNNDTLDALFDKVDAVLSLAKII